MIWLKLVKILEEIIHKVRAPQWWHHVFEGTFSKTLPWTIALQCSLAWPGGSLDLPLTCELFEDLEVLACVKSGKTTLQWCWTIKYVSEKASLPFHFV